MDAAPRRAFLEVRNPRLALENVGVDWYGRHAVISQLSNATHLLFPAGERFFVRSVVRYQAELPPELATQVKAFCKQEGRHAQAHERFFDNLRARGYDVDGILSRYERIAYGRFEKRASPALRLAVTAALEHYTALFAADALSRRVLDWVEPDMRHLLAWHALEELEHKSVAFDVLKIVAPSYWLRMRGLFIATIGLFYFWVMGARVLLAADGLSILEALRVLRADRTLPVLDLRGVFAGVCAYLRPAFHPDDVDHRALIATTLDDLRREGALA